MKKNLSLFIGLLLLVNFSQAQKHSDVGKPVIVKPSYFDISPPLRDMFQDPDAKVDMTWKDGVVRNQPYPRHLMPKNITDAIKSDPNVQTDFGSLKPAAPTQNFDGVGANNGVCPPDPSGDVGPNHYFDVVNLQYAIYSKAGVKLVGPFNTNSIWSGMPNNSNDGDAIVLYDEHADRWMMSQFSLPNYPNANPSYMMIAISQTADPTGSWYRYQYTFNEIPDYPKFGIWEDAYYLTTNRFNSGGNFLGPGAIAFDRAKMLLGNPAASMVSFPINNGGYYHGLCADCDGDFPPAGTPGYFCWTSTTKMTFYEFHVDWTTPANSTFAQSQQLNITPFTFLGYGVGIPQQGTSVKLDPLSYPGAIMNRLQFRNFGTHWSMVTNSTVNAGSNVAGIRWYEFRRNATDPWSVYQQATYAPADGHSRWCGSIAMDGDGNIALGYSVSSASMFPSIRYTGRMSSDPLNTFTIAETDIIAGGGSQTNSWSGSPSRWGDYSAMTIDPTDPNTFWFTTEYYSSTSQSNWKTRITSFSFADFMNVIATATPSTVCSGQQTQLNAQATGGSGVYTYSWSSVPAGFSSTLQNPVAIPTVTTQYVATVSDGASTKNDTTTVTLVSQPTANAGPDATYPNTTPLFPAAGSATSFSTVKWLTAGDGHFNIDTVPASLYYPGPLDKSSGGVNLTLKAYPIGSCDDTASDGVHITLSFPSGTADNASRVFGVSLSPNPSGGIFSLVIHGVTDTETRIAISDIAGKDIYNEIVTPGTSDLTRELNLTGYPKGIYFVKVHTNQQSATKKLVLQ